MITVYQVACCLLAIYYSILQLERYSKNEDASVVSFRTFNERPEDGYPEITFCLEHGRFDDAIQEFSESDFQSTQSTRYVISDILKGQPGLTTPTTIVNQTLKNIVMMDPRLYSTDLIDILKRYSFRTNKKPVSYKRNEMDWKDRNQVIQSVFYTSHQDPERICFTRNSTVGKTSSTTRIKDEISFDFSKKTNIVLFKLFLHPPGQLLRNLEGPMVETELLCSSCDSRPWLDNAMVKRSTKITLTIPSITTLRRRNTNLAPCDSDNIEDIKFRETVIDKAKCIPKYWEKLVNEDMPYQFCQTMDELQMAFKDIVNVSQILSMSTQPCIAMLIPADVQKDEYTWEERNIDISVLYTKTEYQEIVNVMGFDFNSMFSGVGGFVGIFMGYSLLQATDFVLVSNWKRFPKMLCNFVTSFSLTVASFFVKGILFRCLLK